MTITHDAPVRPATGVRPVGAPPDTTALLHAAAAGHEAAWRELIERYEPVVSATIVALRLQPADAADAAQGTWLRMVEHHREIREPEALGGWLRTTAHRECLRIIRSRPQADSLDLAGAEPPDRGVDVERTVVDADTVGRLRALVDLLPPTAAALVAELFGDAPPPYGDLSRRLGIAVGSIGPTRARALSRLRRLFESGVQAPSRSGGRAGRA